MYCIDTSSLVNLKSYPADVFPSVWELLGKLVKADQLISPLEVYNEIKQYAVYDEIKNWCIRNERVFKGDTSMPSDLLKNFKRVEREYDPDYWKNENNKLKPWADPWVVTLALSYKAIVINEERESPNRIQFIAKKVGLKSLNLLDFFRELGLKT